jgi:hypothetical protein
MEWKREVNPDIDEDWEDCPDPIEEEEPWPSPDSYQWWVFNALSEPESDERESDTLSEPVDESSTPVWNWGETTAVELEDAFWPEIFNP